MLKIYHNPRCRKSREGLAILEESGFDFEVIKYLDAPPTENELSKIVRLLNIPPMELVRKNEKIWKESFKGKSYSDEEIVRIMVENPKLIERPIVFNENNAIIGRPPSAILEFF